MSSFLNNTGLAYFWGKITSALGLKADASTVYTKTEVDDFLDDMVYLSDDDGSATTASFDAQADTVWHKAQTLSSAQQAQARSNIGAQEALVSGTNIKTINNENILGSGNITVSGGGSGGSVTVDTALSTTSTNPVQNAVITANLNGKAEKITEVNHGTSDTSLALTPNVLHVWGTVGSLTLTLGTGESGVMNEYMFQFDSGSTATTLSLPSSVKWITDSTIEANKTYQVSILNNLAVMGGA